MLPSQQNSRPKTSKVSNSTVILHIFFLFASHNKFSGKMTEKNRIRSSSDSIMKNNIFFTFAKKDTKWDTKDYFQIIQSFLLLLLFFPVHDISFSLWISHNRSYPFKQSTKTPSLKPIHQIYLFAFHYVHFTAYIHTLLRIQAFPFWWDPKSFYCMSLVCAQWRIGCLQQIFKLSIYKLISGFVDFLSSKCQR